MRHWPWGVLLALGSFLPGCGPADSKQPQAGSQPAANKDSATLKSYAAVDLPPVTDTRLKLDGDRVELSPPEGWKTLPRDPKYLIRLVKAGEDDNSLPRITVTAEPAPEAMADVTEGNAAKFARRLDERSSAVRGRKLLEPERPIIVGGHIWSRHVRYLRSRNSGSGFAAVQSLATTRGGRLYLLELTVDAGSQSEADIAKAILTHRDAAYALAAHWKFMGAAAEPVIAAPAQDSPPSDAAAKSDSAEANPAAGSLPEKNPD